MKLLMKILDMLLHKANITLLFHRTAIGGLKSLLDESGGADLEIDLQGIEGHGKGMGVRPTQLTIKQPAFQMFNPNYDLFQNLHDC